MKQGNAPAIKKVKSKYLVGVYLFPGWEREKQWKVINAHPYLGKYDQGKVQVADWHIKWAAEHGISFFAFDWYWHLGKESLNSALEAFQNANNIRQIKFCLHACNEAYFHPTPGGRCSQYFDWGIQWELNSPEDFTHDFSRKDFLEQFAYAAERYFTHPSYLTVKGRPVYIQYRSNLLMRIFGVKGLKAIHDEIRKVLKRKGLGLYLVAGGSCVHPEYLSRVGESGYDAITSYNYPWAKAEEIQLDGKKVLRGDYDTMTTGYTEIWQKIQKAAETQGVDFIPPLLSGFDNTPWSGSVIVKGGNPEKFKALCQEVKLHLEKNERKITIICAWNEWGEGSVIEPACEWGFDYLDAVKETFTSGKPCTEHQIPVVPNRKALDPLPQK